MSSETLGNPVDLNLSEQESELLINDLIENEIVSDDIVDLEDRFSRHMLYFKYVGRESSGQKLLSNKKVGLIGVGGIGTNVAMILAAAGIGELVLLDADEIEESNLTRQFLYNESSIGQLKVTTAAKKIKELNSSTKVLPVSEHVTDTNHKELFSKFFSDCDVVVLSADSPAEIHTWINQASLEHGFPYSNAGYIEAMGVVGPLVIPGETACYECFKFIGDEFAGDEKRRNENLNEGYQTPSYGPLNSMVSAVQANEIIRYFLGLEARSKGNRLLINSQNYVSLEESFLRKPDCPVCSILPAKEVI